MTDVYIKNEYTNANIISIHCTVKWNICSKSSWGWIFVLQTYILKFSPLGMCVVSAAQKRVRQEGCWSTKLKVITAGACAFIVLGSFIFGLTLSQSIIKDEHGVKGDKSRYTC